MSFHTQMPDGSPSYYEDVQGGEWLVEPTGEDLEAHEEELRGLKRKHAYTGADVHDPQMDAEVGPEEEESEEMPLDLNWYFDQFELPAASRVKMCRSYATYLATTMPKKEKITKK